MRAAARLICQAPVFYADAEGQTRRIAERLAAGLRRRRVDSRAVRIGSPQEKALDWSRVRGAVVAVSTNRRWYQNDLHAFVSAHANDLNNGPSAFLSISLATGAPSAADRDAARRVAESFPAIHAWKPSAIVSLHGRIVVGWLEIAKRWMTMAAGRQEEAAAAADYEFTGWDRIERLAETMAGAMQSRQAQPHHAA